MFQYSTLLDKAGWKLHLPESHYKTTNTNNLTDSKLITDDDNLVFKVVEGVIKQAQNGNLSIPSFATNNRVKRAPR